MKQTKHTHVYKLGKSGRIEICTCGRFRHVGNFEPIVAVEPLKKSNARLIASAHELLSALKDLTIAYRVLGEQWAIERCEDGNFEAQGDKLFPIDNCEDAAKKAIAKAEGRTE